MVEAGHNGGEKSALPAWQAWLIPNAWWVGLAVAFLLLGIRITGVFSVSEDFYLHEPLWLLTISGLPPVWMMVMNVIATNPFSSREHFKPQYRSETYVVTVLWLMTCLGLACLFYWNYLWQAQQQHTFSPENLQLPTPVYPSGIETMRLPLFALATLLSFALKPLEDRSQAEAYWKARRKPVKILAK